MISRGRPAAHSSKRSGLLEAVHDIWQRIDRLVWYVTAFIAVCILLASIPGYILFLPRGFNEPRFVVNPAPIIRTLNAITVVMALTVSLLSMVLAVILFRRRSSARIAIFLSFYLLLHAVIGIGSVETLEPFIPGISQFNTRIVIPLFFQPIRVLLLVVFPDGRFVPAWSRWLVVAAFVFAPVSLLASQPLDPASPYVWVTTAISFLSAILIWGGVIAAQIHRYRKVSTAHEKQQTKWVVYGMGLSFLTLAMSSIVWGASYTLPPDTPFPIWLAAASPLWILAHTFIPVSLAVAVLRYRLFDIDLIINRTLVYGILTALVVGTYVLVVGALGTILQAQGSLLISLVGTGLIAVLVHPLRVWLQERVNRLMYGEGHDPYQVISHLGQQLEGTLAPDKVLPTIVDTIRDTLKLPYVAVALKTHNRFRVAAAAGERGTDIFQLPLTYQGEVVGELQLRLRDQSDSFTISNKPLFDDLARQAGAAVYAARVTAELRRSREQLVTTREEERRRIRRNLHDGLGPTLASLALKIGSASTLVESDPARTRNLLKQTENDIETALQDIRRLVYDLRPPTLDELGLVGAIREIAAEHRGIGIAVEAPDELEPLPAAVEVAAYRIVQEALTNVIRHAGANSVRVQLWLNGGLLIEIEDDGKGIGVGHRSGVGLTSMRERAEELSGELQIHTNPTGGTVVHAFLPFSENGD